MLAQDDDYSIHSGLDFWFLPQGAKVKIPVRWKQFLITWSAIFPLGLAVPLIVVPIMRRLGLADVRPLTTFVTTGIVVAMMVYVVMPRYTRLVRRWLFE
jgi:antibiotic biosynthesis monooxygenase (ABM) superfamily enzyme